MSANTTTVAAKLPVTMAGKLEAHAKNHRLTVSLLLRRLVERELDGVADSEPGPIEATTRARLEELLPAEALDPRAAVAVELARRLDVDPSNGAQHSRELSRLLDDVDADRMRAEAAVTTLDVVHARRVLRLAGYGVVDPTGRLVCEPDPEKGEALVTQRQAQAEVRQRLLSRMAIDEKMENVR